MLMRRRFPSGDLRAPWNDVLQNDVDAPWNDRAHRGDPCAPWNSPWADKHDWEEWCRRNGYDPGRYRW